MYAAVLVVYYLMSYCDSFIIPNELPSILSIVYSNIPPIKVGFDTRFGYGFRIGPHADFQTLIEIGPQTNTNSLSPNATFSKRQSVPSKRAQRLYLDALRKEPIKLTQVQKDAAKSKKFDKTVVGKVEFKKIPGIDDVNEVKSKNLKSAKVNSDSLPTKFVLL